MSADLLRTVPLQEAADRLGVSVRTLFDLRRRGEIRTVTFGRITVVPLTEIARVLTPVDGPVDVTGSSDEKKIELFPRLTA